jgi:hypothetical protein
MVISHLDFLFRIKRQQILFCHNSSLINLINTCKKINNPLWSFIQNKDNWFSNFIKFNRQLDLKRIIKGFAYYLFFQEGISSNGYNSGINTSCRFSTIFNKIFIFFPVLLDLLTLWFPLNHSLLSIEPYTPFGLTRKRRQQYILLTLIQNIKLFGVSNLIWIIFIALNDSNQVIASFFFSSQLFDAMS